MTYALYPIGRYHVSLVIQEDERVTWTLEFDGERIGGGTDQPEVVVFRILRRWQAHASGHVCAKSQAVTA